MPIQRVPHDSHLHGEGKQLHRWRKLRFQGTQTDHEHTAQLQKALGTEAMLRRITEKIRDTLDETAILQTAVRELAISLNLTSCHTCLYDLSGLIATVQCEYNRNGLQLDKQPVPMNNFLEIYGLLLQGQLLQFCPLPTYPIRERVSVLVCPIVDSQEVLGDIWLVHEKSFYFNKRQIQIVQQVATQCAIAIRQSRLYQAAQGQIRELQNLNRLKDDFISTTSHELRTPLSNIKMATQLLELVLQKVGMLPDVQNTNASSSELHRIAHCLQVLKQECNREINLINDLLTLQQIDAGSHQMTLSPIRLQDWIPQVIDTFRDNSASQSLQQRWIVDIPTDLPPFCADFFLFNRVLGELLINASKFTPPGETIRVVVQFHQPNLFQIQVSNTGIEIPTSELEVIFDRFYRIPSTDPWKYSGTGLGLALVKRVATYLGGSVYVSSSSGQTCFTLNLPSQK